MRKESQIKWGTGFSYSSGRRLTCVYGSIKNKRRLQFAVSSSAWLNNFPNQIHFWRRGAVKFIALFRTRRETCREGNKGRQNSIKRSTNQSKDDKSGDDGGASAGIQEFGNGNSERADVSPHSQAAFFSVPQNPSLCLNRHPPPPPRLRLLYFLRLFLATFNYSSFSSHRGAASMTHRILVFPAPVYSCPTLTSYYSKQQLWFLLVIDLLLLLLLNTNVLPIRVFLDFLLLLLSSSSPIHPNVLDSQLGG